MLPGSPCSVIGPQRCHHLLLLGRQRTRCGCPSVLRAGAFRGTAAARLSSDSCSWRFRWPWRRPPGSGAMPGMLVVLLSALDLLSLTRGICLILPWLGRMVRRICRRLTGYAAIGGSPAALIASGPSASVQKGGQTHRLSEMTAGWARLGRQRPRSRRRCRSRCTGCGPVRPCCCRSRTTGSVNVARGQLWRVAGRRRSPLPLGTMKSRSLNHQRSRRSWSSRRRTGAPSFEWFSSGPWQDARPRYLR